ncbi:unnamed protein product, partial [Mesorhabditis belari]|uniref:NUDE domain-containing protein n=1 Tax=Mesorhabditis belari TaxID=2138241 RepID=A0AAF3FEJ2_9BILA
MVKSNENDAGLGRDALLLLPPEKLIEKILHLKILYDERVEEFDEFRSSSKEIELMQDAEIGELQKEANLLRGENQRLKMLQENAQERVQNEKKEWFKDEEKFKRRIAELTNENAVLRSKVVQLEQQNDILERGERINQQTLQDIEKELNDRTERQIMLETELAEMSATADEYYRLKKELGIVRPCATVEPLRIERPRIEPHIPVSSIRPVPCLETKDDLNQSGEALTGGLHSTVNRVVRNLLSKLDRLETLLSSAKTQSAQTTI